MIRGVRNGPSPATNVLLARFLLPKGRHYLSVGGPAFRAGGEFRALTEDAVRQAKTQDLQRAVAALQVNPVVLSEPAAVSFSHASTRRTTCS